MFQKICGLFVLVFLLGVPCFSQIELVPASHDFGDVKPGQEYTCKAKIVNSSSKTVTLSSPVVSTNSGTASIQKNVLGPKGFTWMTINYTPDAFPAGPQFLNVTFTAYFTGKKGGMSGVEKGFQVKALVRTEFTLIPSILMGSYLHGQKAVTLQGQLAVDPKLCPDWSLVKAESDSKNFTTKVSPLANSKVFSVQLAVPADLPVSTYSGQVTIKGRGKTANLIQYPYHIIINSLFDVEPPILSLGPQDPQKAKTWKALSMVRRIDGKPFKIEKIEGTPEWLKYDIQKNSIGTEYTLHWTMDEGKLADKKEIEKSLPKTLALITDSTFEKEILLAVTASHSQLSQLMNQNLSKPPGGAKKISRPDINRPVKTTQVTPGSSPPTKTPQK